MKKTFTSPGLDTPAFRALRQRIHGDRAAFERMVFGILAAFGRSPELMLTARYTAHLNLGDEARISQLFADEALQTDLMVYLAAVKSLPPWTDMLSFLHADVSNRSDRDSKGQHFTPPHMADVIADLFGSHQSVMDPCCGAGALILGYLRASPDVTAMTIQAVDLDPLCCAMTALQIHASGFVQGGVFPKRVEITKADVIREYLEPKPYLWMCESISGEESKQLIACATILDHLTGTRSRETTIAGEAA